jgi:hypothetical protein
MKNKGKPLLFISFVYLILISVFYKFIPNYLGYILWGIGIILITISIRGLNSPKSTTKERIKLLEKTGFFSGMISLLYSLSIILIGISVYILFSNLPGKLFSLWLLIIGLTGILFAFFMNKRIKKN